MWSEDVRARVAGPLAPFADGFRAELDRLGYRLNSRESKVNEMSRLSRWLESRGLGAGDLDDEVAGAFLADFGKGRRKRPTIRARAPLIGWLLGRA
jgi:integrase/recombinase XerD